MKLQTLVSFLCIIIVYKCVFLKSLFCLLFGNVAFKALVTPPLQQIVIFKICKNNFHFAQSKRQISLQQI